MEYKQSLYRCYRKSKFRVTLGISSILFAVIWILTGSSVEIFELILCISISFNGVIQILGGNGYLFEDFFGKKSFVHIDEKQIQLKTISKENQVYWSDIKMIEFFGGNIKVTNSKNQVKFIAISHIRNPYQQRIISTIEKITELKSIEFFKKG